MCRSFCKESFLSNLNKPDFFWQNFLKISNVKFYEYSSIGSRIVLCGQAVINSEWHGKAISVFLLFFKRVYKFCGIFVSVNKSPDSILKCVAILLHVHNALVLYFLLGSSPVDWGLWFSSVSAQSVGAVCEWGHNCFLSYIFQLIFCWSPYFDAI